MQILSLAEIRNKINIPKIIALQEEGFVAASKGKVNIPMPGFIQHENPTGSYHIKYGHIYNDKLWVVKIAGGPKNLPLSGMMIAINTVTGEPEYLLKDQGYLTSLRTAVAGLIAAKFLANKHIKGIGIIGTGTQARMQLEILKNLTDCNLVYVWGRSDKKLHQYKNEMTLKGFDVKITEDLKELTANCNLIVTTTSSIEPILKASDIQPGTHITAVGADSIGKIELEPKLVALSDIRVVDSKLQCIDHGEVSWAIKNNLINERDLIELGEVIANPSLGRKNQEQITIADLTGLAVQDIQIVKAIIY